jgi:hypothetical protein
MSLSFIWHVRELFRACLRQARKITGTEEPA